MSTGLGQQLPSYFGRCSARFPALILSSDWIERRFLLYICSISEVM